MIMIIDHCDKTISIKVVYFGPALSGKTTSIKSLFSHSVFNTAKFIFLAKV